MASKIGLPKSKPTWLRLDANFFLDDDLLDVESKLGEVAGYRFLKLCCLLWQTNTGRGRWSSLPAYARLIGCGADEVAILIRMGTLFKFDDEFWWSERLIRELKYYNSIKAKAEESGRRGAEKRWKTKQVDRVPIPDPNEVPIFSGIARQTDRPSTYVLDTPIPPDKSVRTKVQNVSVHSHVDDKLPVKLADGTETWIRLTHAERQKWETYARDVEKCTPADIERMYEILHAQCQNNKKTRAQSHYDVLRRNKWPLQKLRSERSNVNGHSRPPRQLSVTEHNEQFFKHLEADDHEPRPDDSAFEVPFERVPNAEADRGSS